MLVVKNLVTTYGPVTALKNISLHVGEGEIVCLIGANGAGKSSLMLSIMGLVKPRAGEILFERQPIQGKDPPEIVARGISLVPEGRQIFYPLTVEENLELGAYQRFKKEPKESIFHDLEQVYQLFPRLKERRRQLAGTLSGGEQQMLAIGRAFMAKPKLLMLDEPSLGLAPRLVDTILSAIKVLNKEGLTILLVEQNARKALSLAHRGYVLETGKIILQGRAEDLLADEDVRRAYLGKDYRKFTD